MEKLWAGRTAGTTANLVDEINSSIGVDKRLYKRDIAGSKIQIIPDIIPYHVSEVGLLHTDNPGVAPKLPVQLSVSDIY